MRQHQAAPGISTKVGVRRNLFAASPKDTEDWLQKELSSIEKKNRMLTDQYNFDFEEGKPLDGRYSWTKCK